MVFNVRTMPPKDPLNAILIIDNKDMEKTKDQIQKPAANAVPLAPKKAVQFVPQEIWERILKEEQEKERKNAGPPVLWPVND
jgi:hypothetical protein|tara:strand:+ start:221 stop:466 length:246 start_codon:yes stop_codon:yes gene_type:complete